MAIGDVFEIRTVCVFGDQTSITVNHIRSVSTTGVVATTAAAVAARVSTLTHAAWKGVLVADATFYGISATRIYPTLGPFGVGIADAGAGVFGTDAGPRQVAGILSKSSNLGGATGRGRMYLPFPAADATDPASGHPTTAYRTAAAAIGTAYLTPMVVTVGAGTETFEWIIYNRAVPLLSPPVIGGIARAKWGTQKRRGDYGRTNTPPF